MNTDESLHQPAAFDGPNFAALQCGSTDIWTEYRSAMPRTGMVAQGKLWVKELLGLTGMEFSLGVLSEGAEIPFVHAHQQNEELYLVLSGRGEFSVDETLIPLREGTLIRVLPEGRRTLRNTGAGGLAYVVVQAKAGSLEQWTDHDGLRPENQTAAWELKQA